jgi:hypothetical protein
MGLARVVFLMFDFRYLDFWILFVFIIFSCFYNYLSDASI